MFCRTFLIDSISTTNTQSGLEAMHTLMTENKLTSDELSTLLDSIAVSERVTPAMMHTLYTIFNSVTSASFADLAENRRWKLKATGMLNIATAINRYCSGKQEENGRPGECLFDPLVKKFAKDFYDIIGDSCEIRNPANLPEELFDRSGKEKEVACHQHKKYAAAPPGFWFEERFRVSASKGYWGPSPQDAREFSKIYKRIFQEIFKRHYFSNFQQIFKSLR